ncbi:uncharacterized protein FIBRA_06887 [Fibroporia radiculosa]|uniref:Protoheme IX farnesyltransferase, mitochondrial n=1 Tax=Fibroporia radiculosa TaxID=599839 RepID=J4IBI1_9APHY|nr:uncharacterized protein FIBRA_06887 [Fibroporia radiculosa]CCM04701.1 predicted protein [Fibroporia radiculosa]
MTALSSSLIGRACRHCTPNVRRAPRPISYRLTSTLAASKPVNFAWFFFHNNRWTNSGSSRRSQSDSATSPIPITQTGSVIDASQHPQAMARGYRQTEVLTPRRLLKIYTQLSKGRLTALVVLTTMSGVALCPLPTTLPVLLSTAIGTTLCSASANTLNQIQEVPFDAQMSRTRMRPLVRRAISPLHAAGFAAVTGITGPVILWTMANPTTACLGFVNIALYAGAYTWLKRKSILNTWVGAIVGAIPPLMGWTACGGNLLPTTQLDLYLPSFLSSVPVEHLVDNSLAPLALFALLFGWQFPHFNSLSHLLRESYAQAGYRMLCVLSPAKNALVSLRHTLLFFPICSILIPLSGLTTWTFSLVSLVPNLIVAEAAWTFWRSNGEKQARRLFYHCLWYLPVILGTMMFCKRGLDWTSWMDDKVDENEDTTQLVPSKS